MDEQKPLDSLTLSEDTCATLDAIVVHESEDYFLVEITSERARQLIDAREGFLERLLAISSAPHQGVRALVTSKAPGPFDKSFASRPLTDTWHPESSSRELSTGEYARATPQESAQARHRLKDHIQRRKERADSP